MYLRSPISSVLLLGAACGGLAVDGSGSGATRSPASGALSATTRDAPADAGVVSSDGGSCIELPKLAPADLSCNGDTDCVLVPSGTVCACGCRCANAAANGAAQTRVQSALRALSHDVKCTEPPCGCPFQFVPRCFAHQCAVCGNPALRPLPGQPAACTEEAGVGK